MNLDWLDWGKRLMSIAQNGLAFAKDPYDAERYRAIHDVASEIISAHAEDINADKIKLLIAAEQGYATPKIDVRGGVFDDDKILLVRERSDGLWSLPGGWADINDSPSEAVTREIEEESGFKTIAAKLVAMYDRNRHDHPPMLYHVYKTFFLCDIVGGEATHSIETDAVKFFSEHEIGDLSTPRVTLGQIHTLFKHNRDRSLPTEFD